MASRKEMMGMDTETLRMLGLEAGLSFEPGLSKSKMVIQLETHQASGWLDVNSQLLHADAEGGFDHMQGFTGYEEESISDAARVASSLAGAGYTETFHAIMGGGKDHHVDALNQYMAKLGVNSGDVWMHLPKPNPNVPPQHFNMLKGYLNNHWDDYQDIMPPLEGHYAGDIMGEYSTNKGTVADSYNHLASMYLNKAAYNNPHAYEHDAALVATRLASAMGNQFLEVGYGAATGAKVGYHSILPQLGSNVVHGTQYPREALNAAGLPLGATGSAVQSNRAHYSLVASLLGRAEGSDEASKAIRQEVSSTMKSLASSYKGGGETGMNPYRHETSEHDLLLDSATRYIGVEEARSGYANLDDTSYNRSNIQAVIENNWDKMDAQAASAPSGVPNPDLRLPRRAEIGTQWSADLNEPMAWNSARSRREGAAIADLDASYANFREVADGGRGQSGSPIHYHQMEQGSDEWHNFRQQYDITGSTVGGFLGSNQYVRPWAQFMDKLGVTRKETTPGSFQERIFAAGHRTEDEARVRVSKQLGMDITQVGAITNDQYPGMMYSPDGLIGDDMLWEHKNPERAGKFADLNAGEHADYMDQVQLGMLLSGRSKTLFSQTIGQETRSQTIDRDPTWYERNQNRLDSVLNRMQAGRDFIAGAGDLPLDEIKSGARRAVTGEGLWKDVSQKSNRGYSELAGTDRDPFLSNGRRSYTEISQGVSDYKPNFVTGSSTGTGLAVVNAGDGAESGTALAVKQGVLAAREEVKRSEASGGAGLPALLGGGQGDADFDQLAGITRDRFDAANGGSGGGGRNGGGNGAGSGSDNIPEWLGGMGSSLYGGLRTGSLRGVQNGTLDAIEQIPLVGGIIRGGVGAAQAAGEGINTMSNYRGMAEDAGMESGVGYAAMNQGLEMMGLNANQAGQANQNVHSAYNRMANGDPSSAVQLSVATRGLITLADVRASGGDPTRLAEIFRSKAQERGWSQARIAGAAEAAGLDGFARVATRSDYTMGRARSNVDARMSEDVSQQNVDWEFANADRAYASTDYSIPRVGFENLSGAGAKAGGAMQGTFDAVPGVIQNVSEARQKVAGIVEQLESGGDMLAKSAISSARGSMQTLAGTLRDPGYGVTPAKNNSPEELRRVGLDYLNAMFDHYKGDLVKGSAAYVAGPGAVDNAIKQYGDKDWINHIDPQAQKRVKDLQRLHAFDGGSAGTFRSAGSNGNQNVNLTINVNATVNNKGTKATVTNPYSGEVVSINANNGSVSQRR